MPKNRLSFRLRVKGFFRQVLLDILTRDVPVPIHVLPGGKMPTRQTDGAVGYDACIRAVVSAHRMDSKNPILRETLFDFNSLPDDPEVAKHIFCPEDRLGEELVYRLLPGESVLVGVGFVIGMPPEMVEWVTPRSGLASKQRIVVRNAPGTVDPDYRGEAGVLVLNESDKPFDLFYGMRIAQALFQWSIFPFFIPVGYGDLPPTRRGAGGFGSTGLK